MIFGRPFPWKEAAERILESQYLANARDDEGIAESERGEIRGKALDIFKAYFRRRFYEAITHEYVVSFKQFGSTVAGPNRLTNRVWKDSLGVDEATTWRWENGRVSAGGENLFAPLLLILDLPITSIRLQETNDKLLSKAILGMLRILGKQYGEADPGICTADTFLRMTQYARLIPIKPKSLYAGDSSKTAIQNSLTDLANYVNHPTRIRLRPTRDGIPIPILPSRVKAEIDLWSIPLALFSLGYVMTWKKIKEPA